MYMYIGCILSVFVSMCAVFVFVSMIELRGFGIVCSSVLKDVAVCCSVLQCVAVCCSEMQ